MDRTSSTRPPAMDPGGAYWICREYQPRSGPWREPYNAHGGRRNQINLMIRYAGGNECHMSTLVRHFGDLADGQSMRHLHSAPQRGAPRGVFGLRTRGQTALFRVVTAPAG
jgi:hypothetical protein